MNRKHEQFMNKSYITNVGVYIEPFFQQIKIPIPPIGAVID